MHFIVCTSIKKRQNKIKLSKFQATYYCSIVFSFFWYRNSSTRQGTSKNKGKDINLPLYLPPCPPAFPSLIMNMFSCSLSILVYICYKLIFRWISKGIGLHLLNCNFYFINEKSNFLTSLVYFSEMKAI